MEQKNSNMYAIDRETIKVRTNAHRQNSFPRQILRLKFAQMFFEHIVQIINYRELIQKSL